MLKLVIWWIFFAVMTWLVEFVMLCSVTLDKTKNDRGLYNRIGDLWIDEYFYGIYGFDKTEEPGGVRVTLAIVSLFVALFVVWPFDRVVMYIRWRNAFKQVERESKERS